MNLIPVIFLQSLTYTLGSHIQNSIFPTTSIMGEENLDLGSRQQREIVGLYKECLSEDNVKTEKNNKLDKDYLISAHWGSTVRNNMEGDKSLELTERSKEDCLHKYKTFKFTKATTHWPTMAPPQTATYRILNPNPYCQQKHTVDKSKKPKAKDIPLDIPVIIHSRNGL